MEAIIKNKKTHRHIYNYVSGVELKPFRGISVELGYFQIIQMGEDFMFQESEYNLIANLLIPDFTQNNQQPTSTSIRLTAVYRITSPVSTRPTSVEI
jgi:hypothetical protein